jgi:integral membrane sensor domain MASE1
MDFWLGLAVGALAMIPVAVIFRPKLPPRDEHGRFVKRRAF